MSYSTNYRPFIKLGAKGIASTIVLFCLEDVVGVMSYLKKCDYQPGKPLTWEDIKDNVKLSCFAAEMVKGVGFQWTPSFPINQEESSSVNQEISSEQKEASADQKKDKAKDELKGPLEYTGTLERLQRYYQFAELVDKALEAEPNLWSRILKEGLTKYALEGYSLLTKEYLKIEEQQREHNYEMELVKLVRGCFGSDTNASEEQPDVCIKTADYTIRMVKQLD